MAHDAARYPRAPTLLLLVLARITGQPAVYGALVNAAPHPGTILGVTGPLVTAASRRRFLAGALPADPDRASWGQRQQGAFPLVDLRLAPVLGNAAVVSPTGQQPLPKTATYRQEYVRCGKATCTTCRTGPGHGPYWYAYWREAGRVRKRYLGKQPPPSAGEKGGTPT